MKTLINRPDITHPKTAELYNQFGVLLRELDKRPLTPEIRAMIDQEIDHVNFASTPGKEFAKKVKAAQRNILRAVEKELKIVPKNYYKKLWTALGLTTFGIPIGMAIGLAIGNVALFGIGMPFGMVIGLVVGASMDKKALEEGRQLDFEVKL